MKYLIVDGMLSGTGIRDATEGGYLSPEDLGVSSDLSQKISRWLACYEEAHFDQFEDQTLVGNLDLEGLEIRRLLEVELPESKIHYFSNAKMKRLA